MPYQTLKNRSSRLKRKLRSLGKITKLTLSGNGIEVTSNLKNAVNPVLLIYGFGASRRTLTILESRLHRDGYNTFSLNLGGILGTFNTNSIEELARYIDTRVEELYKKYKIKGKLSIIGHSKGGLIGAYYTKFLGGRRRVKHFISLGAPHNGNPWAQIAAKTPVGFVLKSVSQMSPNGEFIKHLRDTAFPKNTLVYSIYSKDDVVCPYPVSVLEESKKIKNIEIPNASHSELLIKKSVYNAIKHGLQGDLPESWLKKEEPGLKVVR